MALIPLDERIEDFAVSSVVLRSVRRTVWRENKDAVHFKIDISKEFGFAGVEGQHPK